MPVNNYIHLVQHHLASLVLRRPPGQLQLVQIALRQAFRVVHRLRHTTSSHPITSKCRKHTIYQMISYHPIPYHTIPYHTIPHHTTPHHTTPHRITSHHITPHITPHNTTSHHTTTRHITPHHITPHHITSHLITSHLITSHHIKHDKKKTHPKTKQRNVVPYLVPCILRTWYILYVY